MFILIYDYQHDDQHGILEKGLTSKTYDTLEEAKAAREAFLQSYQYSNVEIQEVEPLETMTIIEDDTCPNCSEGLEGFMFDYCPWCGQPLSWEYSTHPCSNRKNPNLVNGAK